MDVSFLPPHVTILGFSPSWMNLDRSWMMSISEYGRHRRENEEGQKHLNELPCYSIRLRKAVLLLREEQLIR